MEMKQIVLNSLTKAGINLIVSDGADIDLREYIQDSLVFISFIVELEENLGIEIPYEMLTYDSFSSLDEVCQRLAIFCMPSNKQDEERIIDYEEKIKQADENQKETGGSSL